MKIFVAYPYGLDGYRETLADVFGEPEYELVYADEHLVSDHVLRKIQRMLQDCDLALFDVTGANPNVTLELGMAIEAEHPYVVAIHVDAVGGLNADIHGWDQLRYHSVAELGESLKRRIEQRRVPSRQPAATVDAELNVSPLGQKPWPLIPIQPSPVNPDSTFLLQIKPEKYNKKRHTMEPEDDRALVDAERRSRGTHQELHGPLQLKDGPIDGVLLSSADPGSQRSDGAPEIPFEQIQADSDGEIIQRFRQNDENTFFQYLAALASGYVIAQEAYIQFGIAPSAHFHVTVRLDARRQRHKPVLPGFFEDSFSVNLKEEFAAAFIDTTMRILRASGATSPRSEVAATLIRFGSENVLTLPTHRRWIT